MLRAIKRLICKFCIKTGRARSLYRKFGNPNPVEWASYLARWGGLHSVGDSVRINLGCNITDPTLVRIGNNMTLSDCTLLGHDGVIRILNTRFDKKLDAVGPIDIRDNCFIGHGAIVMPRVTIGPDSIVAAGAVVTKDVAPGMVVGGNPAKVICTTEELVARMEARCETYPWIELIRQREGAYDPKMQPALRAMRSAYFFADNNASRH